MPSQHARLGPSAASRWLACPASVRLSAEVAGYSDSPYAREGTIAHSLAEVEASYACGLIDEAEYRRQRAHWFDVTSSSLTPEQRAEITEHAVAYGLYIKSLATEQPGTVVLLEQRVYPGVPQCYGTGDAVLVYRDGNVRIVDFKYGAGVPVSATDNPQLMLYGLGALEGFGDIVAPSEWVECIIYQPRVSATPSVQRLTAAELRTWRDTTVLPLAEEALSDTAHFNPGEIQCRWCPAAGICRPRMEAATAEDFSSDPDIVDDDELGAIMGRLPEIEDWVASVKKTVMRKLYEDGHPVPGWKVVLSNGRRSITDADAAAERLAAAGYPPEATTETKPKTLGALEKLVGKEKLAEVLGDVLKKSDGNPALARETDPRPAVSSLGQARADFQEDA